MAGTRPMTRVMAPSIKAGAAFQTEGINTSEERTSAHEYISRRKVTSLAILSKRSDARSRDQKPRDAKPIAVKLKEFVRGGGQLFAQRRAILECALDVDRRINPVAGFFATTKHII